MSEAGFGFDEKVPPQILDSVSSPDRPEGTRIRAIGHQAVVVKHAPKAHQGRRIQPPNVPRETWVSPRSKNYCIIHGVIDHANKLISTLKRTIMSDDVSAYTCVDSIMAWH